MTKRFNLWEKIVIQSGIDEAAEETVSDDQVEGEVNDSLFDLAVSFILNLPEDSIPEDMKATYDSLISTIGDDYLGSYDEFGSEEEEIDDGDFDDSDSEYDDEDPMTPMFKDEELKPKKEEVEEEEIELDSDDEDELDLD